MFLDRAPQRKLPANLEAPGREEVKLSGREAFVYYPDGMIHSKLKLPFAKDATARNLNTVRRLLARSRVADT